ncbi:ribosome silencing factor [Calditrichota bacterium]
MPVKPPKQLTSRTIARRAALWAAEKQANDIVVLDLREVTDFADYFVICTGAVDVHVRAIADNIEHELKKIGWKPKQIEGKDNHRWVLMDYVHVIVHVFQPQARGFYSIERLWGDAKKVTVKGATDQ